jgi:hypothetical protein
VRITQSIVANDSLPRGRSEDADIHVVYDRASAAAFRAPGASLGAHPQGFTWRGRRPAERPARPH